MVVLDASAAFEFLANSEAGRNIAGRLARETRVHAPYLLDIELTSLLRRLVGRRELRPRRALEALEDYKSMRIVRYGHIALLPRIWELRGHFTAYDACYLALAEVLGATLLTCDVALAEARLIHGEVQVI